MEEFSDDSDFDPNRDLEIGAEIEAYVVKVTTEKEMSII